MKIGEATMQFIVPQFMRDDKTVKGFCAAADVIFAEVVKKLPMVNIKENLEMLTEEDLDYIAKIENITWYDTTYIRVKKEKIIKNFEANCFILGTKTAVRNVTLEIFGENKIREWFEYGGQEKHFNVYTDFTGDIRKAVSDYEKRIEDVKSFRSLMDDITFFNSLRIHQVASGKLTQTEEIHFKEGKDGRV